MTQTVNNTGQKTTVAADSAAAALTPLVWVGAQVQHTWKFGCVISQDLNSKQCQDSQGIWTAKWRLYLLRNCCWLSWLALRQVYVNTDRCLSIHQNVKGVETWTYFRFSHQVNFTCWHKVIKICHSNHWWAWKVWYKLPKPTWLLQFTYSTVPWKPEVSSSFPLDALGLEERLW